MNGDSTKYLILIEDTHGGYLLRLGDTNYPLAYEDLFDALESLETLDEIECKALKPRILKALSRPSMLKHFVLDPEGVQIMTPSGNKKFAIVSEEILNLTVINLYESIFNHSN